MTTPEVVVTSPNIAVRKINGLIEVCLDSEKDYGLAAADARSEELKNLFLRRERERASYVIALQHVVREWGAFPENECSPRGIVHRGWSAFVRAMTIRNDQTILAQCIETERQAIRCYDAVLDAPVFPRRRAVEIMLRRQRDAMFGALADLRDRVVPRHFH